MLIRVSYGAAALLATTVLTQPRASYAQEADPQPAPAEETTQDDSRVLSAVVVRGAYIPDEKRETSEVASLIDSEDFSVRGDSDVAAALRRVTGVSIDSGGKFIYVRGLNERYTNSILNGSTIPSPEPLRKVAPLDLFPTSVLESTLVQKTFSPSMSGEFAGGVIDIRTKAVPNEGFFEIGGSLSGDTETSFTDGLLYDGGAQDYFGFDDGTRDLPGGLGDLLRDGSFNSLSLSERNAFSRELTDDSSLLVVQEGRIGPDFGIDLSGGSRIDVNDDLSVGLLGALSYSNEWSSKNAQRGIGQATYQDGEFQNLTQLSDFDRMVTTNTVGLNAFASVGIDIFADHELKFVAFGTRSTDKKAEQEFGSTNDESNVLRERLEWIERELWTTQVQGEHVFPSLLDLEVSWRGSYSEATRDAPYQIFTSYEAEPEAPDFYEIAPGSTIEFAEIADDSTDAGIDFLLPLDLNGMEVDLKAGYAYTEKDREADSNTFILQDALTPGQRVDLAYREYLNDPSEAFQSARGPNSPAFYVATQEVDAYYAGIDAQLTPFLRTAIGARYEEFIQAIETRAYADSFGLITPPIEEDTWLPAATVTWNFADNLQLRMGYSETLNRPQFREVGPSLFTNTETNEQFIGNPFLKTTNVTNYDARLEWYFGRDQFLTVGAFYKELEDPIEAFNVGAGESRLVSFVNIAAAEIQGLEFEFQRGIPFDEWLDWDFFNSKDFSITLNYTYSDSEIDASEPLLVLDQTAIPNLGNLLNSIDYTTLVVLAENDAGQTVVGPYGGDVNDPNQFFQAVTARSSDFDPDRQLQGLSQHLANLQIGYRDDEADADLNLLLNFQSDRIRSVESISDETPAIIEEPPVTLDIVYRKGFNLYGGEYSFGMKLQNLLGDEYEAYQEADGARVEVDTYKVGTSIQFSLSRKF